MSAYCLFHSRCDSVPLESVFQSVLLLQRILNFNRGKVATGRQTSVSLLVEHSLPFSALIKVLLGLPLINSLDDFLLLKLVQDRSLILNQISMSKWEEIDSFVELHLTIGLFLFLAHVFQCIVSIQESLGLDLLILHLFDVVFVNLVSDGLGLGLLEHFKLLAVLVSLIKLFFDLDLEVAKDVLVIRMVENHSFGGTVVHLSVNESLKVAELLAIRFLVRLVGFVSDSKR